MAKGDYTTVEIEVLKKWENPRKPGGGSVLRVVQSLYLGKDGCKDKTKHLCVGIESAVFYPDKNTGETKYMSKPLNRYDFSTCKEKWPQILHWFDNPPPTPDELGGNDQKTETLDEVPF